MFPPGRNPFWSQVRSGIMAVVCPDRHIDNVVIPSGVRSGQAGYEYEVVEVNGKSS